MYNATDKQIQQLAKQRLIETEYWARKQLYYNAVLYLLHA